MLPPKLCGSVKHFKPQLPLMRYFDSSQTASENSPAPAPPRRLVVSLASSSAVPLSKALCLALWRFLLILCLFSFGMEENTP